VLALLLLPTALASSTSTAFSTDAGGWSGGTLGGGVLTVTDGATTLTPGTMGSFTLTARVRLTTGTALGLQAGDATLAASYTAGGGLSFGTEAAPLPLGEQAWTADAAAIADGTAPAVAAIGGGWRLYSEVDGAIVASTSTDGSTWTDAGIVLADGAAPDAVIDGADLVLFYTCGAAICRATSADGLSFAEEGMVLDSADAGATTLDAPSAVILADGTWRLWFTDADTGATGEASSPDGLDWTWIGEPSADASRLHALDAVPFTGGTAAAWDAADGIHVTPGDTSAALSGLINDRGPVLAAGFAPWSPDAPATPTVTLDGNAWTLWVEGVEGAEAHVGRARGTPSPGTWVGLVVTWDGAVATAAWGAGPVLSAPLTAADALTFTADGTLEIDEAWLVYEGPAVDTGGADTGDTGGDTATVDTDTGDTDTDTDTDTGDTGATDTGDTDTAAADTAADTGPLGKTAAELTGEPGGCGCSAAGPGAPTGSFAAPTGALATLFGLLLIRRRAETP
jgi:MYXO-CTERM domain-containing protein